jgi:hypothetical protein
LGIAVGEKSGFVSPLEVHFAIAGVDFVENAEVVGNGFSNLAISGGSEHDAATVCFLPVQKVKNLLPIRKTSGVKMNTGGEFAFQCSSSGKQPEGKFQERDGPGLKKDEDALPQQVAPDQSAVEIDAQNRRRRFGGFRTCDGPHRRSSQIAG